MSIGIYICYKKVVRGENCSDILSVGENDVYYTFIFKVLCKAYNYIIIYSMQQQMHIEILVSSSSPPPPGGRGVRGGNLNISI